MSSSDSNSTDHEFATVPGYNGRIQVNRLGETRHCRHCGRWSKPLKNATTPKGYVQMALRIDSRRVKLQVHRLVYTTFVGPIPEGMTIDHKDRNRSNNTLQNLRAASGTQQRQNQRKHCLRRDARAIYVWRLAEPDNLMLFPHSRKAAEKLGANQRALRTVANGKAKRTGEFSARWAEAAEFYEGEVFRTVTIRGVPVHVSNFGRYLDSKTKKFAVTPKATDGNMYPTVGATVTMHKAVALAWPELVGGEPGDGRTIDHIDRNRENNRPDNLRWATPVQQAANRSDWTLQSCHLTHHQTALHACLLTLAPSHFRSSSGTRSSSTCA